MPRAWFLDRDGTLIVHKPYLHQPAEVELLPGVQAALRQARERGEQLFLFTNQSGVGRGLFTLADVAACNRRMLELLDLGADLFAATCIAPEAPGQPSLYRKPSPRFIQEQMARHQLAAADCAMIGDSASDWEAGLAAGITAIAVESDLTTEKSEARRIALGVRRCRGLPEAFAAVRP